MRLALFSGCKIPSLLAQYELASRAVLKTLAVELVDITFNCCGYPNRNHHFGAYLLSAARNLALARQQNLNILTLCKCCYGSLRHADHWIKTNERMRDEINAVLKKEDLFWDGSVEINHLLPLLARDIGLPILKDQVRQRYSALKIAPHYGCHALRPANIMQYDNPVDPTLFEDLVAATGAQSVNWPRRLECCGNPILEKNAPLSFSLMHKKINDAKTAGADYLCTACTYCQIQFDTVQAAQPEVSVSNGNLPSILYPQLLGLAFGLDEEALGLRYNQLDINGIRSYLVSP